MNKIKNVFIELTPFFVAIIITTPLSMLGSLKSELLITATYILILATLFFIRYKKEELKLLILGIICGIIVEGWGKILFLFSWQKFNSILPVPLYIPLAWGFGFIIMRRIGNIMIKKLQSCLIFRIKNEK